jgi:hypothetical protein
MDVRPTWKDCWCFEEARLGYIFHNAVVFCAIPVQSLSCNSEISVARD